MIAIVDGCVDALISAGEQQAATLRVLAHHAQEVLVVDAGEADDPAALAEARGYEAMAGGALDDARSRGLMVVPSCDYVASYIDKHPAYADLLAG